MPERSRLNRGRPPKNPHWNRKVDCTPHRASLEPEYDLRHTLSMKVAISVPDPIFLAADKAAKRMRLPRSQFYARAVEAYLEQTSGQDVTERLNAVYGEDVEEPDRFLEAAAKATLRRSR